MIRASDLWDTARRETGLEDMGGEAWRDGFETLVTSLNEEARLSELGEAALGSQILRQLQNRLRLVAWTSAHPLEARAPVRRPLFVLGMPRTGTTLLSYLLACDHGRRSLLRWEALDSIPPPSLATLRSDPRVESAARDAAMLDALNPEFKKIHDETADGPTECVAILAQDFRSLLWETEANIPSYGRWLDACDHGSAYAHHARTLRALQSAAPGRWTLKSPHHCLALEALIEQYPDARLVMTHRDPVAVTASLCSLVKSLSGTFSDAAHDATIARRWPAVLELCAARVIDFRERHPGVPFLDVHYQDLVTDPVGVVRRIEALDGHEPSPGAIIRMRDWLRAHPAGKHGPHRYSLEPFGLREAELRERFRAYTERFEQPGDTRGAPDQDGASVPRKGRGVS